MTANVLGSCSTISSARSTQLVRLSRTFDRFRAAPRLSVVAVEAFKNQGYGRRRRRFTSDDSAPYGQESEEEADNEQHESERRRMRYETMRGRMAEEEPFGAELLLLVGLPFAVLMVPWVCENPYTILVPVLLAVFPGTKDVFAPIITEILTDLYKILAAAAKKITEVKRNRRPDNTTRQRPRARQTDILMLPQRGLSPTRDSSSYSYSPRAGEQQQQQQPVGPSQRQPSAQWGKEPQQQSRNSIPSASSRTPAEAPNEGFGSGFRGDDIDSSSDRGKPVAARQEAGKRWREENLDRAVGRILRAEGDGRIGINVQYRRPWWNELLVTVFPFLRSWGGFL